MEIEVERAVGKANICFKAVATCDVLASLFDRWSALGGSGSAIQQGAGLGTVDFSSTSVSLVDATNFLKILLEEGANLERFTIYESHVGDAAAGCLADLFCNDSCLQRFVLRDARIGDEGAIRLANVLSAGAVQVLNLSTNQIGDEGISRLADWVECNADLRVLNMSENHVGDAGAARMAEAISNMPRETIFKLHVSRNRIQDRGALSFEGVLKLRLVEVHFSPGNAISEDVLLRMAELSRVCELDCEELQRTEFLLSMQKVVIDHRPVVSRLGTETIVDGEKLDLPLGCILWDAPRVFMEFFERHRDVLLCMCPNPRVLEVGAGTGVCGLYAGADPRVKSLVLTDCADPVLRLLAHNCALNSWREAQVSTCWWGHVESMTNLGSMYDIIIASECSYATHLFQPLAATFQGLLAENGLVILVHVRRDLCAKHELHYAPRRFWEQSNIEALAAAIHAVGLESVLLEGIVDSDRYASDPMLVPAYSKRILNEATGVEQQVEIFLLQKKFGDVWSGGSDAKNGTEAKTERCV